MSEPRRWKLWRIDRGEGDEVWQGADGPATNPPDDCGLTGTDWVKAATVEVVEASQYDALDKLADDLAKGVEAEEELLQALRDKAAPCSRCGGDGRELIDGGEAPCGDCEGTGVQVVLADDSTQQPGVSIEGDPGPTICDFCERTLAPGEEAFKDWDGAVYCDVCAAEHSIEAGVAEATSFTISTQQQLEQSTTGKEDCER